MINSVSDIEAIIEKYADETSDGLHVTEDNFHALAVELAQEFMKGDNIENR